MKGCSAKIQIEVDLNNEFKKAYVKGDAATIIAMLCVTYDECPEFKKAVEESLDFYNRAKENNVKLEIEVK